MKYVGVVTQVNQTTGFVHLANREYRQAVSFLDRSGRFEVDDIVYLEGVLGWQNMVATAAPTFVVKADDAPIWEHAVASGVRITNHVRKPMVTILSPDPAPQPIPVPGVPPGTGRALAALAGLVLTQWHSKQDDSVVEVTEIYTSYAGKPRCRLRTISNGHRRKRVLSMEVSKLLARYDEHLVGYVLANGPQTTQQVSP